MANETADFGKTFILSYEENDPTRPILAVKHNPTTSGLITPTVGQATGLSAEFITAYPTTSFAGFR